MKAYLMSIPDSIKGIGDKLNVKSMLCDKSWVVFNDEGIKIVYIFQKDGSLVMSQNGVVVKSKWDYIKANKSILIDDNNQTLLLHPTFVDDVMFILQQDGSEKHIFMIDETKIVKFVLLTLDAITEYLNKIAEKKQPTSTDKKRLLREQIREQTKNEIKDATKNVRQKRIICWIAIVISIIVAFSILISGAISEIISIVLICLSGFSLLIVEIYYEQNIAEIENKIIDSHMSGSELE